MTKCPRRKQKRNSEETNTNIKNTLKRKVSAAAISSKNINLENSEKVTAIVPRNVEESKSQQQQVS